jgi:hypothetical protein
MPGRLLWLLLLLHENTVPLLGFLIQQWLNTDSTCFGSEMTTKSIGAGESTTTTPVSIP